jgi:hypothetical protein
MWRFNDELGIWEFDGYTDCYFFQRRVLEYPVTMHIEKLNMSITEAAIATSQRVDRENFREWINSQR